MLSHSVVSDSLVALWTVASQETLFMGFFRQEYWRGLPFPSQGYLTDPGIEPASPVSPAFRWTLYSLGHQGSPQRNQRFIVNKNLGSLSHKVGGWAEVKHSKDVRVLTI